MSNKKQYKDYYDEKDNELKGKFEETEFERGDGFAMFLAAVITLVIPVLLILLGMYLIVWFLFLR